MRLRTVAVLLAVICAAGAAWSLAPRGAGPDRNLEQQVRRQPVSPDLRLKWAEALAAEGQRFRAIEQLAVALELSPDPGSAVRLADLYRQVGEPEAAAATLQSSGASANELSTARLDLGDFRGAIQPLREAPADLRKARLTLLAGDFEAARDLLSALPANPKRESLRGFTLAQLGRPLEGAPVLRSAAQEGSSAWDLCLLGYAELAAGDPARALQAWLQAARTAEVPLSTRVDVAYVMTQVGRWEQAEAALQDLQDDAIEEPGYWRALAALEAHKRRSGLELLARGKAAFHAGDPWTAERLYARGLQRVAAPEPVIEVRRALHQALLDSAERRFDTPGAQRYAASALKAFPRDPIFLRRRGELLLEQNRYGEARTAAEALRMTLPDGERWGAHDLLARVGLESRDAELFRWAVDQCLAEDPNRVETRLLEAEWRQVDGATTSRAEEMLEAYDRAVASGRDNAEAHANRGVLLVQLRRWEEAVQALLRALELEPRVLEGVPNAQLVQAYRRTGREAEARFHEARYRKLRELKDGWVNLLPSLRQQRPPADYLRLGRVALERHDSWVALCAFGKATRLRPTDPAAWEGVAAAEKRRGHFLEALGAMRRAHQLRKSP